jgi:hypothetical protein
LRLRFTRAAITTAIAIRITASRIHGHGFDELEAAVVLGAVVAVVAALGEVLVGAVVVDVVEVVEEVVVAAVVEVVVAIVVLVVDVLVVDVLVEVVVRSGRVVVVRSGRVVVVVGAVVVVESDDAGRSGSVTFDPDPPPLPQAVATAASTSATPSTDQRAVWMKRCPTATVLPSAVGQARSGAEQLRLRRRELVVAQHAAGVEAGELLQL